MKSVILLLILCFIAPTLCATNRGIGDGVIAVIFFIVIGIFICCLGKCLAPPLPIVFGVIGFILPLFVLLILYVWPKESDKDTNDSEKSDSYTALRIVWYIFIILGAILSACIYVKLRFMAVYKAQIIDTGFSMLEDIFRRRRKEIPKDKRTKKAIFLGKDQTKPIIKERDYNKKNLNKYYDSVIEDRRQLEEQEAKQSEINPYTNFDLDKNYTDKRPNINYHGERRT